MVCKRHNCMFQRVFKIVCFKGCSHFSTWHVQREREREKEREREREFSEPSWVHCGCLVLALMFVSRTICLSVRLSVCLSVDLSVCVCLSVYARMRACVQGHFGCVSAVCFVPWRNQVIFFFFFSFFSFFWGEGCVTAAWCPGATRFSCVCWRRRKGGCKKRGRIAYMYVSCI